MRDLCTTSPFAQFRRLAQMHDGLNYNGFVLFNCIVDSERKTLYQVSSDIFLYWMPVDARLEDKEEFGLCRFKLERQNQLREKLKFQHNIESLQHTHEETLDENDSSFFNHGSYFS